MRLSPLRNAATEFGEAAVEPRSATPLRPCKMPHGRGRVLFQGSLQCLFYVACGRFERALVTQRDRATQFRVLVDERAVMAVAQAYAHGAQGWRRFFRQHRLQERARVREFPLSVSGVTHLQPTI